MYEIAFIVILILSVVLHEVSHGWVAYAYGDNTAKDAGRLTINPIPHIDFIGSILIPTFLVLLSSGFLFGWAKPVPYNPYNLPSRRAEALVAAAGAITNIFLAVLAGVALRAIQYFDLSVSTVVLDLLGIVILVNIFLAVLNLLPIPPLDGYKVVQSLLNFSTGEKLRNFERDIFAKLGFIGTFLALFIGIFIILEPLSRFVHYIASLIAG